MSGKSIQELQNSMDVAEAVCSVIENELLAEPTEMDMDQGGQGDQALHAVLPDAQLNNVVVAKEPPSEVDLLSKPVTLTSATSVKQFYTKSELGVNTTYLNLIKEAIVSAKNRKGMTLQNIKAYLFTKYGLDMVRSATTYLQTNLKKGVEIGIFTTDLSENFFQLAEFGTVPTIRTRRSVAGTSRNHLSIAKKLMKVKKNNVMKKPKRFTSK